MRIVRNIKVNVELMGELELKTDYHQVIFLEAHIEGTWWQMLYFWLKMLYFWKNCFIFRKKAFSSSY